MRAVVVWLKKTNTAGSIASDYSLYTALDRERERAKTQRLLTRNWNRIRSGNAEAEVSD